METLASLATSFMVTLVDIGGENFTASSANMKLHVNVHVSRIKRAVNRLHPDRQDAYATLLAPNVP